jgi:hypothetical protein
MADCYDETFVCHLFARVGFDASWGSPQKRKTSSTKKQLYKEEMCPSKFILKI